MTKISNFIGSLILLTSMFGAGVLSFPESFKDAGWIVTIIFLLCVGYLTIISLFAISMAAKLTGKKHTTYSQICSNAHHFLGVLVDIFTFLNSITFCMIYILYISKWISKTLCVAVGYKNVSESLIAIIILIIIFYPAYLKNIKAMEFISIISISAFLYLIVLIFYYFLILSPNNVPMQPVGSSLGSGLSPLLLALGCHSNMISVYNSLKEKTVSSLLTVASLSTAMGVILFFCIGFFPYFLFKNDCDTDILTLFNDPEKIFCKSIIMNSWDKNLILPKIAVITFCFVLFSSFCLQLNPGRQSFIRLVARLGVIDCVHNEPYIRLIVTLLYCLLSYLVVFLKVNIKCLINFVSAVPLTLICYVFPSIAFYSLNKESTALSKLIFINGVIGFFIMIFLLTNSF